MPVFRLGSQSVFPPPHLAEENGLLAIGGDLSPDRLLLAYSQGIFPWYNPGEPILWWAPSPRCVLLPGDFHLSHSMKKRLKSNRYRVTFDQSFSQVIQLCSSCGSRMSHGTWITPEMISAYEDLYRLGYSHSVEVWEGEELSGGLYGVALGRCFFGESMFHLRPDCSKIALYVLSETVFACDFNMIDMQLPTPHLLSLGGRTLDRASFERLLQLGTRGEKNRFPEAPFIF